MNKIRMLVASLCAIILLCGLTVTAYASSDEDYEETTGGYEEDTVTEEDEAKPSESSSFTVEGTGTVTDTATDEDGKQFYTITTPAGNTFYLIIDLERDSDNVYFLDGVTEADLLALAELSEETVTTAADTEQEVVEADTDAETTAEPETEQQESDGNAGMLLLVAAVVLIGGGAAWYLKIHRSKQQMAESEDDYGGDSDPYYDAESYADETDDDGPPWDEGGDGEE